MAAEVLDLKNPNFTSLATPMSASGWSDAPADLLWKIIDRLPIGDYIRFGAVCVVWCEALSEKRRPPAPQAPLLMVPGERSGVRFFSQPDNKEYSLDIPEMGLNNRCIGSSGGWLVSADEFSELHMFNPFNPLTHLRLPSVVTLPDFVSITESLDLQNWHHTYFIKVVVSFSSPFIAVAICTITERLVFAMAGGNSWSSVSTGHQRFHDMIFYEDQLYAMSFRGTVVAIDISDVSHPRVTFKVQPPDNYSLEMINYQSTLKYLVESPDGNIYQICRQLMRGARVRVFKMIDPAAQTGNRWIELENLGDHALFLGHNHSLALSARDFPEVRRNCIYFTDNRINFWNWQAKCKLGVYNMEDGSFTPYYGSRYRISRPPVWFDPTKLGHIATSTHHQRS